MAEKILGPQGSKRRKRFLWVPMLLIACTALFVIGNAQAVHDLSFQLDGDVSASTTTSVGGTTQTIDWDTLFDAAGATKLPLPAGFTTAGFDPDFVTNANGSFNTTDTTTFATGSKDTLSITPGWQCNRDANVNSKIDIMNAYAAAFTSSNNHQILYFSLERNSNSGDGNVGFWFLQGNVGCVSPGGSTPFTGNHVDGDLLIVSAFTGGGSVSTIDVYRWNGGANGSLGTTSVAHGVDCKTTTGGDSACATVNGPTNGTGGTITTPWPTANKQDGVGHSLRTSEFFEGGLDLTANNLGGKCFNVFIADTRSSQSLTATLFDFARGSLGECTVSVTTTPSSTADRVLGSTTPITDTANIVGADSAGNLGPTPTGTMSFFLCGPAVTTCTPTTTPQAEVSGNPKTLGVCNPPQTGHACATSGDAQGLITGTGTYCFRAVYDPGTDANYQGKGGSFTSSGECFTVTAVASTSTTQKWLPQDTAHVTASGGATVAGYVVFQLFENTDCSGGAPVQTFGNDPAARLTVDGSGNATTNNQTYYVDQNVQISWRATFTSTNSGVGSGSPGPCERSDIANLDDDTSTP
jgi:hypothetical protein